MTEIGDYLNQVICGDCIDVMGDFPDNSIDAIVTDPPYGLGFMGKEWDKDLLHEKWLTEAHKVLKPGASMLVMGGTRTFHRLMVAIEDSGFIIKDCLMWIYGSGFPKAQDLGKMIDKRMGKEREVVKRNRVDGKATGEKGITDLAKKWDGFKIGGIKPAYEPIVWAAKPPEGSYVDNVLKWGVGAVNVDECRVGIDVNDDIHVKNPHTVNMAENNVYGAFKAGNQYVIPKGRFPANIILDEDAGRMMDEQSGDLKVPATYKRNIIGFKSEHNKQLQPNGIDTRKYALGYGDSGGASRFFYCAKASRGERESHNEHPTVKPVSLFEWLIMLITREGQIVLDPFFGSGSTGIACNMSARKFIGIEQEVKYCKIAEKRIAQGALF